VWDIYLKKVEIESFIKSFLIFFISQTLLSGALFFMEYKKEIKTLDETLFSEMRICSFELVCPKYEIGFAPLDKEKLYKLYKSKERLSSYFSIAGSSKNALEIYLPQEKYQAQLDKLKREIIVNFFFVMFIFLILSIFFAIYTLSPLKNALRLTEEFIKDILHDFNTPLSTMRLNASMLKEEIGENKKLQRIENSVQNILNLQSNLKAYLSNHEAQNTYFTLESFIQERVALLQGAYKNIAFEIDVSNISLHTNKEAFQRVIDNLLSNAAKYSKGSGKIKIEYSGTILQISDNGKGIKNPKKVFERFYKEQDRGIGIGLHIVQKLCSELDISISLESELEVGTTFFLDIKHLL
jgi:signal transduction histidine kinase